MIINRLIIRALIVRHLTQSSTICPEKCQKRIFKLQVVCPAGFEPTTSRLEGDCSIQLSYGHKTKQPTAQDLRWRPRFEVELTV